MSLHEELWAILQHAGARAGSNTKFQHRNFVAERSRPFVPHAECLFSLDRYRDVFTWILRAKSGSVVSFLLFVSAMRMTQFCPTLMSMTTRAVSCGGGLFRLITANSNSSGEREGGGRGEKEGENEKGERKQGKEEGKRREGEEKEWRWGERRGEKGRTRGENGGKREKGRKENRTDVQRKFVHHLSGSVSSFGALGGTEGQRRGFAQTTEKLRTTTCPTLFTVCCSAANSLSRVGCAAI